MVPPTDKRLMKLFTLRMSRVDYIMDVKSTAQLDSVEFMGLHTGVTFRRQLKSNVGRDTGLVTAVISGIKSGPRPKLIDNADNSRVKFHFSATNSPLCVEV